MSRGSGAGGGAAPAPDRLAAELRSARNRLRLGLQEVAQAAGISAGYLSRLERGEQRCPRVGVAARLARVLDLDRDLAEEPPAASVDECDPPVRR